jgi:hypothetical protein
MMRSKRSCKHKLLIGSVNTCDMRPRDSRQRAVNVSEAESAMLRATSTTKKRLLFYKSKYVVAWTTNVSRLFRWMFEVTTTIWLWRYIPISRTTNDNESFSTTSSFEEGLPSELPSTDISQTKYLTNSRRLPFSLLHFYFIFIIFIQGKSKS